MNIVRHMELTIMQDDKEEQEQQATEDYRKNEQYPKEFVKHITTGDERIPGKCEELFTHVFMRNRSCKAAGTKDSRNIQSISGYLVITRIIGNEGMDDKCMQLSLGIYR